MEELKKLKNWKNFKNWKHHYFQIDGPPPSIYLKIMVFCSFFSFFNFFGFFNVFNFFSFRKSFSEHVGQSFHKLLFLQQPRLWVFYCPVFGFKVIYYFSRLLYYPICFNDFFHSGCFCYTILNTRGTAPNKIKIPHRINFIIPIKNVSVYQCHLQI